MLVNVCTKNIKDTRDGNIAMILSYNMKFAKA
jgi:hypothetical protein